MAGPDEPKPPHEALRGVPIVNLVIDIGDYDEKHSKISREEHDRYVKGVRETAAALREQGIPTVWVAITDQNRIHDKWGQADVEKLRMTELGVQKATADAPGDILFEKRFMSGFTTQEQLEGSKALADYIASQRKDGANYKEAFANGPEHTLTHLLRDVKHVIVNGGMGQYCVTDNSIDAALQGKGVTVVNSNVMAWADMGKHTQISMGDADFSGAQVKAMLDELKANPALRALPPAVADAIDKIQIKGPEETIAGIPALKEEIAGKQALSGIGSKFGAPAREDSPAPPPSKLSSAMSGNRAKMSM